VPTADAVDGYSVDLIAATKTAAGQAQQGLRTSVSVTKASFTGLDPAETYTVEVRSLANGHASDPGVSSPPADTVAPTPLTATPAGGANNTSAVDATSVALSGTGQIYYTLDSSSPITGDMPSDGALPYIDPIAITGTATSPTEIRAVAFDQAGNASPELKGFYKVPDATAPPPPPATTAATPTGLTGTGGLHKVTLKWTAGDASVTGYRVAAYDKAAAKVSTTDATTNTATVSGLTAGEKYTFTVAATNDGTHYSDASAPTDPIMATDGVTITSAKWKVGDFRIIGSGTDAVTPASTVTLYAVGTGGAADRALGTVSATPAVAPATGTTFDIRLRNAAAGTANPGKVYVKSSLGGVSPVFTATG
jgi:hypothetical protein